MVLRHRSTEASCQHSMPSLPVHTHHSTEVLNRAQTSQGRVKVFNKVFNQYCSEESVVGGSTSPHARISWPPAPLSRSPAFWGKWARQGYDPLSIEARGQFRRGRRPTHSGAGLQGDGDPPLTGCILDFVQRPKPKRVLFACLCGLGMVTMANHTLGEGP